ncbi:glycosyltransferase [Halotia branconii]|uniref:Glycosyltransferase n=1 Tax=Halotia branconii CENA392 TaxID=1539056 RepID=A0AAJ6NPB9_9CYAN|nr:glycosyltransferase [Halotia branconii]WGV24083.1 glycosyltransferase [Halotia branconii CENA392]
MEKIANNTLSFWQEEGSRLIQQNFEEFHSLVTQAKGYLRRGNYEAAAVYADIAAFYAICKHSGLFVSRELEEVLLTIGRKVIGKSVDHSQSKPCPDSPKHVLHVATYVANIGGHSRMLLRWIQQDTERSHSLVLTQQAPKEIPKIFKDAVSDRQGEIYVLNESIGSLISWAKQLREYAASTDVIVLHTLCDDVIPTIAFANKEQLPPIIFVNNADTYLWLGASITDVVANLRESGMRLSQARRGIEEKRNALLPIILSPIHRTLSRTEAKRELGIAEDSILLLSIARTAKYQTIDGISFADAHVPLLEKYKQVILIVIGPGNSEDWSAAIQQTNGRIKIFGEREDTAVFYQAADIYVDSFPMTSITSMLEAGSYGTPLISRHYFSPKSDILGGDAPGLTGNLIYVSDLNEYNQVLSNLVEDEELRLNLGEKTNKKIVKTHTGNGWYKNLEQVYQRAMDLPKLTVNTSFKDQICLGEPDSLLPYFYPENQHIDLDGMIQGHIRLMPFNERLQSWVKLTRKHGFSRLSLLLPEWFYLRYYLRLRT